MAESKPIETTLSLSPKQASDNSFILSELNKKKILKEGKIKSFRVIKKSIDARKRPVKVNLNLLVSDKEEIIFEYPKKEYKKLSSSSPQIIIVGAGPAGLFAGLRAKPG